MIRLTQLIALILLLAPLSVKGQLSGHNLAEFQYGRLPGDSSDIATLYDRLLAGYEYRNLSASATIEQFNSPLDGSSYIRLSQFSLEYKLKGLELKAGNMYETLGRGILLRSFQVPGAVLEDLSYRSRHYFHRDILGASAKFQKGKFMAKALWGKPLNYVFPPTIEAGLRRADQVAALYSEYSLASQTLGLSVMHHSNSGNTQVYGMATLSGKLGPALSYYTEAARSFENADAYALYASLNLSLGSFGASLEYKNYSNFLIGAGINEPPALVKEHSYKVLNRSTHVLQALNESGYQVELFYTFADFSMLTFNHALAINEFGDRLVYQEYFLEYSFTLREGHDVKLFADYAQDPIKLQENRISAGLYTTWQLGGPHAIYGNYEFQTFRRLDEHYQNHVLLAGYSFGSKFSAGLSTELSDDSFVVSDGRKLWLGGLINLQVNRKHKLQLFAGERRGGPACNAGVCYEVLDFSGVELRWTARF